MEYIAFDAHKRYTHVSVETVDGKRRYEGRIAHARGALQQFPALAFGAGLNQHLSLRADQSMGAGQWLSDKM